MTSRQARVPRHALWDELVRAGRDLGTRLSSQERAIRNARAATTQLSRQRVERDAVELYLADLEDERASDPPDRGDRPGAPRPEPHDRSGALGHAGA